jgi:hypothetical protein
VGDLRYTAGKCRETFPKRFDNPGNDPEYVLDTGRFGMVVDGLPLDALRQAHIDPVGCLIAGALKALPIHKGLSEVKGWP